MFSAVIERLSGKAALQERYDTLETQYKRVHTELEQEKQQHKELSHLFVERGNEHAAELKAALSLNKPLSAERDEWHRQNTALKERIDDLFIAIQKADVDKEALEEQVQKVRNAFQHDLVSLQQRHNTVVEERDRLTAIIERYASIPWVALASQSMVLLGKLAYAKDKHKPYPANWLDEYEQLREQHDQIAPVEAVEAKEE